MCLSTQPAGTFVCTLYDVDENESGKGIAVLSVGRQLNSKHFPCFNRPVHTTAFLSSHERAREPTTRAGTLTMTIKRNINKNISIICNNNTS